MKHPLILTAVLSSMALAGTSDDADARTKSRYSTIKKAPTRTATKTFTAVVTTPPNDIGFDLEAPALDPINLDDLVGHVHADMRGHVVGYSLVVNENGHPARTRNWGKARLAQDGEENWTEEHRVQVASVSKHFTAVAMMKLLDEKGISTDSLVAPWMPPSWDLAPGWGDLTFAHLLSHRSGINQMLGDLDEDQLEPFGNGWDGLRYMATAGDGSESLADFAISPGSGASYKNANYALMRILGPRIWSTMPSSPIQGVQVTEANHTMLFAVLAHHYVFTPAELSPVACQSMPSYPGALFYDIENLDTAGAESVFTTSCGAHGGWHLSSMELASLMAHIQHDDAFFSPAMRQEMNQGKFGWSPGSNNPNSERRVNKFWHGGLIYGGLNREVASCVMRFPGGVEASMVVNSAHTLEKSPCGVLLDAYQDTRDGVPVPPAPTPYDGTCPDPHDPNLFGTPGCPCANLDVFSMSDAAFDGGYADGSGSHLANGLYGEGQYCVGENTVCGTFNFGPTEYPRCEVCGEGSNIGCPCDNDAACQGIEPDLTCWGLESNGWGPSDHGQCLPSANSPASRERLEEMPWFCLDNCDAIDASADGTVGCVFNQTSLEFSHGECVDFNASCAGLMPGECEENGFSCSHDDVCEQECQTHTDCAAQGFPEWYECDGLGDVAFGPSHCVPPECTNTSSAYCDLYR
ncbi:MAG: serine hydrolase domain-containing protein [Bradymonadia bacterium]